MLGYLIEKEFKLIMRNSILPIVIFVMPVFMLLILPWATDSEIKNIKIAVVDSDHSTYSRQLIEKISASEYFTLLQIEESYKNALENTIESGDADAILVINQNFEKDLVTTDKATVMMAANAVDGMKGMMGTAYMSAILMNFSQHITMELLNFSNPVPMQQVVVSARPVFNAEMDYKAFMVPAIMLMLIVLICGALPALNIVLEKETGTIEQMNVTPVRKSMFILAKVIPFWIIGFIVLTVGMLVAVLLYGLIPKGSIALIYFVNAIFIVIMSSFGLIVSSKSNSMQQAMMTTMFFLVIFILMSGLLTPISSMPNIAQYITYVNPMRYYAEAMRFIYLKGSTLNDLLPQIGTLSVFLVVVGLFAVLGYKKQR